MTLCVIYKKKEDSGFYYQKPLSSFFYILKCSDMYDVMEPSRRVQILTKAVGFYVVIIKKVKFATIVEGNPKAPFSIATTPMCRGGRYSFPGLLYFTLDPYLIMLSAKQGSIKYHFLSLWYDSTWD